MKYSNFVKAMLLASTHELVADPDKYAVNPGRDFSRNRKIPLKYLLLLLLTMEAECIKEELYHYFGRSADAPSKAAFYKQRKSSVLTHFASSYFPLTQNAESISSKTSIL